MLNGFCSYYNSRNLYVYDPNPNSFDFPPDSYHPPHPTFETYSYDSYGNDSQFGYACQPQFPLNYESEPGYTENYNSYPYDSSSFLQQYPSCTRCGGPHETCQCDQLIFDEPYCKHYGGPHMNFQCQPMNQNSYNSDSSGFDQPQPPQSPIIHQPPQEMSIQEMEDPKQQYLDEMKRLINSEYHDEIKIAELKQNFNVTPSLSTEEPDNSQSMGDEHLDTISATESDEFIKSNVENLIPILSESEGIPDNMCDVPFHDNSLHLDASPPDSELVSSEVMEIVIPKVGGIDDDILLTIKDDILQSDFFFEEVDAFLAVEDEPTSSQFPQSYLDPEGDILLLEAFLNDDPSSDFMTKSSSTSLNSLLEETNTFDNSLPEFETFCFDMEEISSSSTTTHSDISLPKYEAFHDDHVKEISSGSPTTHSDSSLYASFIFDLSINPFPPADKSDFYEFADEPIHFISPPEYDCFLFKIEPNSGDFTMDVVEDISPTREPRVHNTLLTHPTLQLNLKFQPSSESLFTYVVWIFLPFLVYSVAP
nr:hypothetical protein [Tanacetum cinerariifolium]